MYFKLGRSETSRAIRSTLLLSSSLFLLSLLLLPPPLSLLGRAFAIDFRFILGGLFALLAWKHRKDGEAAAPPARVLRSLMLEGGPLSRKLIRPVSTHSWKHSKRKLEWLNYEHSAHPARTRGCARRWNYYCSLSGCDVIAVELLRGGASWNGRASLEVEKLEFLRVQAFRHKVVLLSVNNLTSVVCIFVLRQDWFI